MDNDIDYGTILCNSFTARTNGVKLRGCDIKCDEAKFENIQSFMDSFVKGDKTADLPTLTCDKLVLGRLSSCTNPNDVGKLLRWLHTAIYNCIKHEIYSKNGIGSDVPENRIKEFRLYVEPDATNLVNSIASGIVYGSRSSSTYLKLAADFVFTSCLGDSMKQECKSECTDILCYIQGVMTGELEKIK